MRLCAHSGCRRVAAKLYSYHWCKAHGELARILAVAKEHGWTARVLLFQKAQA